MRAQGIGVGISGMGVYLPQEVRTNDWWPEAFHKAHAELAAGDVTTSADQARSASGVDPEVARHAARYVGDLFRGARKRHVIAEDEQPSDMEVAAARRALQQAGRAATDVDLLVSFSQLNDHGGPANHPLIADKLGMRHRCTVMTVDTACASFVTHLRVASTLIAAGEHERALIVQSAAVSRVMDFRQPMSVNAGDGAVATVLERVEPGFGYVGGHQHTRGDLHAGIRLVPGKRKEPWYRGDLHQSALIVHNQSRRAVLEMSIKTATFCRGVCLELLERHGYAPGDVGLFIPSQPTIWFAEACCEALGIDPARTLNTFAACGHLMPASAPLNLFTAAEQGRLHRGDLVLIYSPGVGFVTTAALYRWC